ncbi:MAG: Stp1/IreP family PP2C-type Ser/Thr phosphatase [Clostridia bacterium]|nr:Stp1/IreP family PP2C-type Ser/Thr phosphatase [Clostridia bacterium]
MKVYAITDIGKTRPINEDSYYAPREGERYCAVADGMGGHNAGEVASSMAIQAFSEYMRGVDFITADAICAAVENANYEVFEAAIRDPGMSGMGTTFSALAEQGETVYIAHVGDSRIYLLRDGEILQATTDHTLVEEMVQKGILTPREARFHPRRNIITRALGTEPTVEIDIIQVETRPGDVFFLCSDGMTNYVEDVEILNVVLSGEGWQEKLDRLVAMALQNGGADNITALLALPGEDTDR